MPKRSMAICAVSSSACGKGGCRSSSSGLFALSSFGRALTAVAPPRRQLRRLLQLATLACDGDGHRLAALDFINGYDSHVGAGNRPKPAVAGLVWGGIGRSDQVEAETAEDS